MRPGGHPRAAGVGRRCRGVVLRSRARPPPPRGQGGVGIDVGAIEEGGTKRHHSQARQIDPERQGRRPVRLVPSLSRRHVPCCSSPETETIPWRTTVARPGSTLLVVGVGCGLAVIGACDVTGPDSPAVFLDPPSLTLEDGQSAKISAKLRNPRARTVVWSSSNL